MSAMASQITTLTIVYSTVYSRRRSKKTSKHRVTGLCEGNSPVTGEFPAQRPSNAEMFPLDDVIMYRNNLKQSGQIFNVWWKPTVNNAFNRLWTRNVLWRYIPILVNDILHLDIRSNETCLFRWRFIQICVSELYWRFENVENGLDVHFQPLDCGGYISWWCHQMEHSSTLLALCEGNPPATGGFPPQRPLTRSLDIFFDLRPNKRWSKQWWGWWFETQSRPLWRYCNVSRNCKINPSYNNHHDLEMFRFMTQPHNYFFRFSLRFKDNGQMTNRF